ncbi:MAG: type II toxin-antitoxin system Phd/YefM family antitoxin [Phycisphaeraceae bacterium]
MEWKLADAKNKLSEVFNLAQTKGPQRIVRGNDAVVLVSERDYEALTGKPADFKQFLLDGPDLCGLDFSRDCSPGRTVKL